MADRIGSRITSLARTYPALTYFVLTLALSWSVWTLGVLTQVHLSVYLGGFGPALAAAVVTRLRGHSVRAWLRTIVDPRTDLRWYVAAVGVPLAWVGTILAGAAVWTGSVDTAHLVEFAPQAPISLLILVLIGGGNEEFGWRGFALPALQERTDALTASLVIGVVWAVWHLPLFVFGAAGYGPVAVVPAYTVYAVGASVVFTWLYNGSGPSILPVMVLHGTINTVMGPALAAAGVSGAVSEILAQTVPIWATALIALAVYGRTRMADSPIDTTAGATAAARGEHP